MRVVATLAVRNEIPHLANCLSNLIENGIDFAIVDNESTDGSTELLRDSRFARHLAGYRHVPFTGAFVWKDILLVQEQLLQTIDTDWILLTAPDEIMHANAPGETLAGAIERLDARGYDVINFDEFVFLPVDHRYIPDHCGPQPLRHYYFWQPSMRAWKKALNLSNVAGAGHAVSGGDFRLAPETLVNRHYIFRDQAHACAKYAHRVFDDEELAIGWHCDRFGQPVANFVFPPADRLERLASPDDRNLSRSHPHRTHYWQWRATEIEDLKSGFNSLKSELGGLATGLGGLETKLGGLESGLGGLASGFDGLRTGLAGLKSELDDLRVEGERQRTQIREMLNSTSWQLTAPLRAIGRRWGWLRRLAGRTGHGSQS